MYDVVVVGGSLAGAATALHLVNAGLRVAILEKSRAFPRRKACGEGLFPAGVRELRTLGLDDGLVGASVPLSGVRFHAGGVTAVASLGSADAAPRGVRRELLDPLLFEHARAAGVDVQAGVSARSLLVEGRRAAGVRTETGEVRARVVVGADGLHSSIRRFAGLARPAHGGRYGLSVHVRTSRPGEPWVDVHFGGNHELYITPVGECELNVALLARKPFLGQFAGDLDGRFRDFLGRHPAMPGGWEAVGPAIGAGPFPVRASRPWRANVILVGDAAGFFDGITGEGMSLALVSARLCARAVRGYLATGDFDHFRRYASQTRGAARNSELLGRLSLTLGERPVLARYAVRNLARRPETFTRLAAINAGELGLTAVRPRDVLALVLGV